MLGLGVIGSSRKENEHRLPIHPDHFASIPDEIRASMRFESGYGRALGVRDDDLRGLFAGTAPRAALLQESDVVLLPKLMAADLRETRVGGVLWGWPHCAQQPELTQVAIDRKLTLIAWESMFAWKNETRDMHMFERNNEMAGYCAVIHALGLVGKDAHYGPPAIARVISHGSVSRGAIFALRARGFADIRVYTQRPTWAVHDKIPGCRYGQLVGGKDGSEAWVIEPGGARRPLAEALGEADLIVNGILQDTDHVLMFMRDEQHAMLKPGALIVDVSCDLAMGFSFAKPTSFEKPTFTVGDVTYYAVDHTPSYLWRSASWELSRVVVAFLEPILAGPRVWDENPTIRRALDIRKGEIQNKKVVRLQGRASTYPHAVVGPAG